MIRLNRPHGLHLLILLALCFLILLMTYAYNIQEPALKPDVRKWPCIESLQKGFACDSWHLPTWSHSLRHVPEVHNRTCVKQLCIVSHIRAIVHTLSHREFFPCVRKGFHTFFQARCMLSRTVKDRPSTMFSIAICGICMPLGSGPVQP